MHSGWRRELCPGSATDVRAAAAWPPLAERAFVSAAVDSYVSRLSANMTGDPELALPIGATKRKKLAQTRAKLRGPPAVFLRGGGQGEAVRPPRMETERDCGVPPVVFADGVATSVHLSLIHI